MVVTHMICAHAYQSCSVVVYLLDGAHLIERSSLGNNDVVARCKLIGRSFY